MVVLTIQTKGAELRVQVARGKQKIKISLGESSILITPEEAALLANFVGDACENMPNIIEEDGEIQDNHL